MLRVIDNRTHNRIDQGGGRVFCDTINAMEKAKRRRGRPPNPDGQTPQRNIRIGPIWDQAHAEAQADGERFAALVEQALTREVKRRQRRRAAAAKTTIPTTGPPVGRLAPYSERKPYTVAENLDDLTGPATGTLRLPGHIDWSGTPEKNLDTPGMLASIYQTILSEASTVADLNALLNRDKLIEVWPTLWLPRRVRDLWQDRFPELSRPHP